MSTPVASDHTDSYALILPEGVKMTAPQLFDLMFVRYPKPLYLLLRLRNWLVKPFHIRTGESFRHCLLSQNDTQVVLGKTNTHLDFQVILQCTFPSPCREKIGITTHVQFHNHTGKIYFSLIRPFHRCICQYLLHRSAQIKKKEMNML